MYFKIHKTIIKNMWDSCGGCFSKSLSTERWICLFHSLNKNMKFHIFQNTIAFLRKAKFSFFYMIRICSYYCGYSPLNILVYSFYSPKQGFAWKLHISLQTWQELTAFGGQRKDFKSLLDMSFLFITCLHVHILQYELQSQGYFR